MLSVTAFGDQAQLDYTSEIGHAVTDEISTPSIVSKNDLLWDKLKVMRVGGEEGYQRIDN